MVRVLNYQIAGTPKDMRSEVTIDDGMLSEDCKITGIAIGHKVEGKWINGKVVFPEPVGAIVAECPDIKVSHHCPDWDWLWITPDMPEWECCCCDEDQ